MLCPKCRTAMDRVEVKGIEVDRCEFCKGLWFDAGEADALQNRKSAARIDTGNAWEGKQQDFINRYRCPRCGGKMSRKTDSKQKHINYETCEDCKGSFFDAGEFLDLSHRSFSDFVKRLVKKDHRSP